MDARIRDLLAERRMPALWFHTVEKAHSKSRLGGLPSLPESVDWPVNPDTTLALHFIAQVDLSALPDTPLPGCPHDAALPRQGMLYFFFNFAAYWDEDYSDTDINGIPKQSRVIHASAAGADRAAPENLPMIGYTPGTMGGGTARKENVLPEQHLRAYAIDTFWAAYENHNGENIKPFEHDEDFEAKFESIVNATGEAPPLYPSYTAIPSPPPSYYTFIGNTGLRKELRGLQMFGAEWWDGGYGPSDERGVLLLEFPLDARELGSLQFWIEPKDLKAQRFDRVFGTAHFT